jgi:hypothetical protein
MCGIGCNSLEEREKFVDIAVHVVDLQPTQFDRAETVHNSNAPQNGSTIWNPDTGSNWGLPGSEIWGT